MDPKYSSSNGFMTKIWGPMLWPVLHMISMNFPVKPTIEDRNNYFNFIFGLTKVLPCGACRKNLILNLKEVGFSKEISLKNRESFSLFMFTLHEKINNMLGNDNLLITFDQYRDKLELFRAECTSGTKHDGCIKPTHINKSKCVISIIPEDDGLLGDGIYVDKRCFL